MSGPGASERGGGEGSFVVVVPTLGRPERVAPLVENVATTTSCPHTVIFVVERHDERTTLAVRASGARLLFNEGDPTYASCINTAYRLTTDPFLFAGADDIAFREGALDLALAAMADDEIGVVGTEDPNHPTPDHTAHYLVRRRYIAERGGCLDLEDTVLYPYRHGFTDHEIVGVAKSRGAYRYCPEALVEHDHPGWDSLGRVRGGAKLDATYQKGNRHHREDTLTFLRRFPRWDHAIVDPSPADLHIRRFVKKNSGVRGALRFRLRRVTDVLAGEKSR